MPIFESLPQLEARCRPVAEQGLRDFNALPIAAKVPVAVVGAAVGGLGALHGLVKTPGVTGRELWDYSFGDRRGKGVFNYINTSPIIQMGITGAAAAGIGVALRSLATVVDPVNHFLLSIGVNNGVQGVLGFGNGSTFTAGVVTFLGAYMVRALPRVVTPVFQADAGRAMSAAGRWLGEKPQPVSPPLPGPQVPTPPV